MSTEKTEGLVIRLADFSETSKVATLFTRDFGKISAMAKGARRLKSAFEAAHDLLAASSIVFIRKSSDSLDLLTEAQLTFRFRPKSRDMTVLYGGYYVAELLNSLTEEYDPHPELYDETLHVLNHLQEGSNPKLSLLRYELIVLREIGQLPDLEICTICGERAAGDQQFAYWHSQSGLICSNCQTKEYSQRRISAGTIAILRRLAAEDSQLLNRLNVSEQQMREMRPLVTSAICGVLGRRPKMMRYLQM